MPVFGGLESAEKLHVAASVSSRAAGVGRRRLVRQCVAPVAVLVLGIGASIGLFLQQKASVHHSDQLILRQDAVQGSLVLSSYVGQTPVAVTQLADSLSQRGVNPARWRAAAEPVASRSGYSALSVLAMVGGRLTVIASVGAVHGPSPATPVASVMAALRAGHTPYSGAVAQGHSRWLTQLVAAPLAPNYVVYSEQPISDRPISLSSLPGHPFSGIQGAVYVGREDPADLVFATTSRLPLGGERAVTAISGNNPFAAPSSTIGSRPGSVSNPGGFILVMTPQGTLSGASAVWLPWSLFLSGLVASVLVAVLIALSERRRRRMTSMLAQLEGRNADLDKAMSLQRNTAARFSAMIRSSSDLTTVISADGQIRYQSPSSLVLLGERPDDLLGTSFPALVHPDDMQLWNQALARSKMVPGAEITEILRLGGSEGSYISVETRITNLLDNPVVTGIVLNGRDVTDHQRLENELRHQAFHDSLTGLANRALFEDRLGNAITRLLRTRGTVGVLFLDIDDFKAINDGRGHRVGDQLLQAVSHRLVETVRAGDTLARIGGDEFAVIVEAVDAAGVRETADRILAALQPPVPIGAGETCVRVSIGVVTTNSGEHAAQELLRDADVAMYAAKNAGKGRIEVFHPGLHAEVISRLQLEVDLGRAVDNDQLAVLYQPVVDLSSGTAMGIEALMRWDHPIRGRVMPGEFIPVAESTGLIVGMGQWLLSHACQDIKRIQEMTGRGDLHLSVNLSIRQLEDPGIVEHVRTALADSGMDPSLLTLEITESVFMSDRARSLDVLEQLKALGVRLSIDDFGTGFSSLGYLNQLPVDELKIDRSFVVAASSAESDDGGTLVHTIVRLAKDFGLDTVAEGIETEFQLSLVRDAGCRSAQGFLFARPLELVQLLAVVAPGRQITPAARDRDSALSGA